MVTPLNKLAQYWRDDANNADLALTLPQRDAMRKCADELQQSFAQFRESKRFFANKGDSEANFIADGDLSCPHCGGSGHAGDMKQTTNAFTAGDMADANSAGYTAPPADALGAVRELVAKWRDAAEGSTDSPNPTIKAVARCHIELATELESALAQAPAIRVTDEMVRRASDACCVVIDTRTGLWFNNEQAMAMGYRTDKCRGPNSVMIDGAIAFADAWMPLPSAPSEYDVLNSQGDDP